MKVLYAIQGTGNGHLSRAMEIAPYLMDRVEVDLLLSGSSAELTFPYPFKYRYHGLSFYFGKRGGVNYLKSFRYLKPFKLISDIKACPIHDYDLIINDFEPISAWAAHNTEVPVIAVSHQASFLSSNVPMPKKRRKLFERGMRYWVAPSDNYIGLHYRAYDDQLSVPIIRDELQKATVSDLGHVTVYLPAFADELLINYFNKVAAYQWEVFSKKTTKAYEMGNVKVSPVNRIKYDQSITSCHALLTGGGFQGTSEGLYLEKKMLSIPMFDQYEQLCNAAALEELGVRVIYKVKDDFDQILKDWLKNDAPSSYRFEANTAAVVDRILAWAAQL